MPVSKVVREAIQLRQALARFDEQTLYKVYFALARSGLDPVQAQKSLDSILDAGIQFRENV